MNKTTRTHLNNLWSEDRQLQNNAFLTILKLTDKPVDWAYEAWDELLANLTHRDNHNRAIAAQVLCNLAKSDPKERILKDFDHLLIVTKKDERFVMRGFVCKPYGKSALQAINNRKYTWTVLNTASKSASRKRMAR